MPKPIRDPAGGPLPGSVSEEIWVDINGVKYGMVIRGKNDHNPVLLWVHGGPGMPDYLLTEQYLDQSGGPLHRGLVGSARDLAVQWPNIPPETITMSSLLRYARSFRLSAAVVQPEKIYLLGHSWGSLIAIEAAARPHIATTPTSGWPRWCTS